MRTLDHPSVPCALAVSVMSLEYEVKTQCDWGEDLHPAPFVAAPFVFCAAQWNMGA